MPSQPFVWEMSGAGSQGQGRGWGAEKGDRVGESHHMLFSELQDIPSAWPLEAKAVSVAKRVQGFVDSASKNQTPKAASK